MDTLMQEIQNLLEIVRWYMNMGTDIPSEILSDLSSALQTAQRDQRRDELKLAQSLLHDLSGQNDQLDKMLSEVNTAVEDINTADAASPSLSVIDHK